MRMGAAKTRDDKPVKAAADSTNPYAPLDEFQRETAKEAVQEQISHLGRVQSSIRSRDGRIKKAKFHAAVLALRWEGFSPKETAEILGCSHGRVDAALLRMREAASIDEQLDRIDQTLVPLAVDNLARGVLEGDKGYTMKVLEGRGLFRSHKQVEGVIRKTVLHLKVTTEMPKHLGPDAIPLPAPGSIVGAPRLPELPEKVSE